VHRTSAGSKTERDVRGSQSLDVDAAFRLPMQNVHCCMSDFARGSAVGLCNARFYYVRMNCGSVQAPMAGSEPAQASSGLKANLDRTVTNRYCGAEVSWLAPAPSRLGPFHSVPDRRSSGDSILSHGFRRGTRPPSITFIWATAVRHRRPRCGGATSSATGCDSNPRRSGRIP
jgi:hypothetical protein